ncbi:hypothetical protein [Peribacillus alkalitolerans]|uniref:hypothetical protein n=1 Tax=Peribacillus alkalitolerans TaxID=1550385 RepID=UPI0013D8A1DA|nr:hypothetical protein [Peribacillus alkalitolerans]
MDNKRIGKQEIINMLEGIALQLDALEVAISDGVKNEQSRYIDQQQSMIMKLEYNLQASERRFRINEQQQPNQRKRSKNHSIPIQPKLGY